ncbi:DUF2569 family protein [Shigella flexneri]
MWYYTWWLTIAFFKRRRCVPKHYIIWLLISVLLAEKHSLFHPWRWHSRSPVAVYFVGTASIVPYFNARRGKLMFVICNNRQLTCCRLLWMASDRRLFHFRPKITYYRYRLSEICTLV